MPTGSIPVDPRPVAGAMLRAAAAAWLGGAALAQADIYPSFAVPYPYDSGPVENHGASPAVVASQTVRVQGAAWVRLEFRVVDLSGDPAAGDGTILRVTSFHDGAVQELDALEARQWRYTSAYFNGDTVQLELVAQPGTGASRVILRRAIAGPLASPRSICGATDDRVFATDVRVARMYPLACTAWLMDDCRHCLTTAGHCATSYLQVAEFDVPLSDPFGAALHPPPEDQYAVDFASLQSSNSGLGDDWATFGCFPNSNTGLTPYEAQGACFQIASAVPAFDPAHVLRVTGFGLDSDPPQANQAQQTDDGPLVAVAASYLKYEVDTTSGSSGSPIAWENGGGVVLGVHTHGGCTSGNPPGGNHGTRLDNAGWAAARAAGLGVCAPASPSAGVYCTAKVNSLGCTPSIAPIGTPSASAGAGSFTITASLLVSQKSGLLYYGFAPLAAPFQGGIKCVAAPSRRTPIVGTGGSPGGDDCTGTIAFDMGERIASGVDPSLACGAHVYSQVWSRDPADPYTTNLTAGVEFTIGP